MNSKIWLALFIFLAQSSLVFSQKIKFTYSMGNTIGETPFLKKNMSYSDFTLGYEFKSKTNFYISTGIGISSLKFDYADSVQNPVFNQRYFVSVPIIISNHYSINKEKKATCFWGVGLINSLCFSDKKEIFHNYSKSIETKNVTGFNTALATQLGFRFFVTAKGFVDLFLSNHLDLFSSYKNEVNKIKMQKNMISVAYTKVL